MPSRWGLPCFRGGAGPYEAGDARDDDASRRREMIEAFGEGYDPALEARAFASDEARRAAELAEAHGEGYDPAFEWDDDAPDALARTDPAANGFPNPTARARRRPKRGKKSAASVGAGDREPIDPARDVPEPDPARSRSRRRGDDSGGARESSPPRLLPGGKLPPLLDLGDPDAYARVRASLAAEEALRRPLREVLAPVDAVARRFESEPENILEPFRAMPEKLLLPYARFDAYGQPKETSAPGEEERERDAG